MATGKNLQEMPPALNSLASCKRSVSSPPIVSMDKSPCITVNGGAFSRGAPCGVSNGNIALWLSVAMPCISSRARRYIQTDRFRHSSHKPHVRRCET